MKVKMKNGKHSFDYKPDGILFLQPEHVVILQRETGKQVVQPFSVVMKGIPKRIRNTVKSNLMHNNLHTTPNYQIMGVADKEGIL